MEVGLSPIPLIYISVPDYVGSQGTHFVRTLKGVFVGEVLSTFALATIKY